MKKEEIRKLMIENFVEITAGEWEKLNESGEGFFECEDGNIYFKPKWNSKSLLVIEDNDGLEMVARGIRFDGIILKTRIFKNSEEWRNFVRSMEQNIIARFKQ